MFLKWALNNWLVKDNSTQRSEMLILLWCSDASAELVSVPAAPCLPPAPEQDSFRYHAHNRPAELLGRKQSRCGRRARIRAGVRACDRWLTLSTVIKTLLHWKVSLLAFKLNFVLQSHARVSQVKELGPVSQSLLISQYFLRCTFNLLLNSHTTNYWGFLYSIVYMNILRKTHLFSMGKDIKKCSK